MSTEDYAARATAQKAMRITAEEHENLAHALLNNIADYLGKNQGGFVSTPIQISKAQAHATLALSLRTKEAADAR